MGVIYKNDISYGGGSSGGSGSSDYSDLTNKPTLNGVSLASGQTTEDLGLVNDTTTYMEADGSIAIGLVSNDQIDALFN